MFFIFEFLEWFNNLTTSLWLISGRARFQPRFIWLQYLAIKYFVILYLCVSITAFIFQSRYLKGREGKFIWGLQLFRAKSRSQITVWFPSSGSCPYNMAMSYKRCKIVHITGEADSFDEDYFLSVMGSELSGKASCERCHLISSVKVWAENSDETVFPEEDNSSECGGV